MAGNGEGGGALFREAELQDMYGVKLGDGFVDVLCGCTSRKYGDAIGRLRIFPSGDLFIRCDCIPGCQEDNLTPAEFEKHASREGARRWKYNVWVNRSGKKIPLRRTPLLKYYNQAPKSGKGIKKGPHMRPCHRDEFICCTRCKKERRFHLRTKEECRSHHDALANPNWKCSDLPYEMINCEDEEERATRKVLRGCPRAALCKGCTTCVCFGCKICRFSDCNCQTCTDFMQNANN